VKTPINDAYAMADYDAFKKRLQYYFPVIEGVRVCELHKSHGIHFHLLINIRIPIRRMKEIAFGNGQIVGRNRWIGFGRMSVKKADKDCIGYLSKYMTKGYTDRNKFWGRRRWGTINGKYGCLLQPTRARDVIIESDSTRNRERIYGRLQCNYSAWLKIVNYTMLWGDFDNWPAKDKANVWREQTKDHAEWMKRYEYEPF